MIVRFESANLAPARIVEMYADEDCIFLRILDSHTIVQFNKDIRVAGHHCFQLGFAQLAIETLGYIESNHFLRWTVAAICAAIFAAVAGIHYHGGKVLARIFDLRSPHACACRQQREKPNSNDAIYQARHSDLIAKNTRSTKEFLPSAYKITCVLRRRA